MRASRVWRAARYVRGRSRAVSAASQHLPAICPTKAMTLHVCALQPPHTSLTMWVAPVRQCTTLITPCVMPPSLWQTVRARHGPDAEYDSLKTLFSYDANSGFTTLVKMNKGSASCDDDDEAQDVPMRTRHTTALRGALRTRPHRSHTSRHTSTLQDKRTTTTAAATSRLRQGSGSSNALSDGWAQSNILEHDDANYETITSSAAAAAATSSSHTTALHTQRRHVSSASSVSHETNSHNEGSERDHYHHHHHGSSGHTDTQAERCEAGQSAGGTMKEEEKAEASTATHTESGAEDRKSSSSSRRHNEEEKEGGGGEKYTAHEMTSVPMPSLPEIIEACKILSLVTASGAVQTDWTAASLKSIYRDLARRYHPDLADGDVTCMEQINVAYERLCSLSAAQRAWVQAKLRYSELYGLSEGDEDDGRGGGGGGGESCDALWLHRRATGAGRGGCLARLCGWLGLSQPQTAAAAASDEYYYTGSRSCGRGARTPDTEYVSDLAQLMAAGFYATLLSTLVWCSSYAYGYLAAWGTRVESAGSGTNKAAAASSTVGSHHSRTGGARCQAGTMCSSMQETCAAEPSMVRACMASTRKSLAAIVVDVLARYAWLAAVCVNAALLRRVFLSIFFLLVQ